MKKGMYVKLSVDGIKRISGFMRRIYVPFAAWS